MIAPVTMRLPNQLLSLLVALCAASLSVAASWGFEDATVSVSKKGAGVGGGLKEKYGFLFTIFPEYSDSPYFLELEKIKLYPRLSHWEHQTASRSF